MHKAMITKAFVGSLVGFAGAVVLFLVAGGLALWNDSLIMNGPDVVGISLAVERLPGLSEHIRVRSLPGWRHGGAGLARVRAAGAARTVFATPRHTHPRSGLGSVARAPLWVLAFFYTVLWNATHSLGLCILLHASFTPAQDHFILMPQQDAYTPRLTHRTGSSLAHTSPPPLSS